MWHNLRAFVNHTPSLSIGAAFAFMSILFGTWITRIPDIQLQAGLSEGQLGLALLGMPVGGMITMPFMGTIISRWGTGKVTFFTSILYAAAMILPAMTFNLWSLAASLVFVGASAGSMDVAMNAAAAAIEKHEKKSIMSTCHGFFSFGGMLGAGLASLMAGWGLPIFWHLLTMSVLMLALALVFKPEWVKITDHAGGGHSWSWPTRSLLWLAAIGFCVLLAEGAIADWSAVYLKNTLGGSGFISGLGFAGFSLTMALGRLYGDILIPKWGARNFLYYGGLLSAAALAGALMIGHPLAAIAGFTIVGLGFSCIVPIIFSAGANVPGVSSGAGLAAIASMGYVGFMVGPPAIGLLAELYGLQFGLGFVALMSLFMGILGKRIRL